MKHRLAVFASGNGSNAENIAKYFREKPNISVCLILTNNPNAGVLTRANQLNIETQVFNRTDLNEGRVLKILEQHEITFVVLAGFLLKIPEHLVKAYNNKIVNIHPALLPKYGGKGMYGDKVHEAVVQSGDAESGITIHWVNENYDEGNIIFQATCAVSESDDANSLANKIHQLEYEHFPRVIEKLLS